jgi:hypothetical protein
MTQAGATVLMVDDSCSNTMAVAYWQFHAPNGVSPVQNQGVLPSWSVTSTCMWPRAAVMTGAEHENRLAPPHNTVKCA